MGIPTNPTPGAFLSGKPQETQLFNTLTIHSQDILRNSVFTNIVLPPVTFSATSALPHVTKGYENMNPQHFINLLLDTATRHGSLHESGVRVVRNMQQIACSLVCFFDGGWKSKLATVYQLYAIMANYIEMEMLISLLEATITHMTNAVNTYNDPNFDLREANNPYEFPQFTATADKTDDSSGPEESAEAPSEESTKTPRNFNDSLNNIADIIDSLLDGGNEYASSILVVTLQKALAMIIAFGIIDEKISTPLIQLGLCRMRNVKDCSEMNVFDATREIVSLTSIAIRAFTGSADPDKFRCHSPTDWLRCARWVIRYSKSRYPVGADPIPGFVPEDLWTVNLAMAYDKMDEMEKRDKSLSPTIRSLGRTIQDLYVVARRTTCNFRPLPFNIMVLSPPGCGKSTVIVPNLIRAVYSGRKITSVGTTLSEVRNTIANVNVNDKYLSSYHSSKHFAVTIDELGSADAKKDSDNMIMTNLTNILGENEWSINRASVDDKGKDFYQPYCTACISNVDDLGARDYLSPEGLEAMRRRFQVALRVTVKPEYAKHVTTYKDNGDVNVRPAAHGIDLSKLGDDRTDAIEFEILTPAVGGFVSVKKGLSFADIYNYVREEAEKFSSVSTGLSKTLASIDERICKHGIMDICSDPSCVAVREAKEEALRPKADFSATSGKVLPVLGALGVAASGYAFYQHVYKPLKHKATVAERSVEKLVKQVDRILEQCDASSNLVGRRIADADLILTQSQRILAKPMVKAFFAAVAVMGIGSYLYRRIPSSPTPPGLNAAAITEANLGTKPHTTLVGNPWDNHNDGYVWQTPTATSCSDPKIAINHCNRNLGYYQLTSKPGAAPMRTHLFGVKDQYAIGPWHFLREFMSEDAVLSKLHIHTGIGGKREGILNFKMRGGPKQVVQIAEDIGMVYLCDVSAFKNITPYVPVQAQYQGFDSKVTGVNIFYDYHTLEAKWVDFSGVYGSIQYTEADHYYKPQVFLGKFATPFRGHCGSPLLTTSNGLTAINGIAIASAGLTQDTPLDERQTGFHIFDQTTLAKGFEFFKTTHTAVSSVGFDESYCFKDHSASVTPVTPKHYGWWINASEFGSLHLCGGLNLPTRKPRTKVITYPKSEELTGLMGPAYWHDLIAPRYDAVVDNDGNWLSPERNALRDMSSHVTNINQRDLETAISDLANKFLSCPGFDDDAILDLDSCINGVPGTGVKSMPKKTGAGFPEGGKKCHHLESTNDPAFPHHKCLNPAMQKTYDAMHHNATEGIRNGVVFDTCAKDEPRSAAKVAERKIRLFTLGPMPFYLLCKQYYGSFMNIYSQNFLSTETVGGVNFIPKTGSLFWRSYPNIPT
jgi:hypothetical protein